MRPRKPSRTVRRATAQHLKANAAAESRYVRDLRAIMAGVHAEYRKHAELTRGPAPPTRGDSYTKDTGQLDLLGVRVVAAVKVHVGRAFDRMATRVNITNKAGNLAVLRITPSDARIAEQMAQARNRNIELVENAARVYADDVRAIFDDPDLYGLTVDELKARLLDRADVSESRAELIARDQTLKLNGAMTQTRQENAGVTSYVWNTSHDSRVRDSHAELDGETFSWDSPPEPGHPGEDYQCRCTALPVIDELEGL